MMLADKFKAWFWGWPDGLVWRLTEGFTVRSRRRKFELFIERVRPAPGDSVLDVGVSYNVGRATNFLELWYPHREMITALAVGSEEEYASFRREFPEVRLVMGDGRKLDFPDDSFDIVFSNAVVEHVGDREKQKKFINELVRVGRRAFITTPNYFFPVESHTLIPLAHYLPVAIRYWIYRKLGRGFWADINNLNLLTPREFASLFPEDAGVRLIRLRKFFITHSIVAVVDKKPKRIV